MTASLAKYDDGKRSWDQDTIYEVCLPTRASENAQVFLERAWWIAGPLPTGRELDPASDTDPSRPIGPGDTAGEPLLWTPTRTGYDGWIDFQTAYRVSNSLDAAALA
jgi:hypothetical protein